MRLFVAIDVSEQTRAHLRRVREGLQRQLAKVSRAPRATWVADGAAHVTIRFIGEVSDQIGAQVEAAMAPPIRLAPYHLEFDRAGAFPNARRPRVLWIGGEAGQRESVALAAVVNSRLDPIVGRPDERAFRAHLTVARVKEYAPFDWDAALAAIAIGASRTPVDHVTLYQSRTSPKGPTYTPLVTTPLAHE